MAKTSQVVTELGLDLRSQTPQGARGTGPLNEKEILIREKE